MQKIKTFLIKYWWLIIIVIIIVAILIYLKFFNKDPITGCKPIKKTGKTKVTPSGTIYEIERWVKRGGDIDTKGVCMQEFAWASDEYPNGGVNPSTGKPVMAGEGRANPTGSLTGIGRGDVLPQDCSRLNKWKENGLWTGTPGNVTSRQYEDWKWNSTTKQCEMKLIFKAW